MGVKKRRLWRIINLLLLFTAIVVASENNNTTNSSSSVHSVVYRGCSAKKFDEGSAYESNLGAVLDLILSHEVQPNSHFYNNSIGDAGNRVYGLFQCKGDVNNDVCGDCKKRIVAQAPLLCERTVGARVQLKECFLRYENSKFFGDPDQHQVYKTCSPEMTEDPAFFAHREVVLTTLEEGSFNNLHTTSSSGPPVVDGSAQCEGDLSWSECANCVLTATRDVKEACESSISGQVYLEKCSVSYSMGDSHPHQDLETNHMTAKTVAIAIGSIAAAIFLFIFLLFLKSLCKNNDD